MNWEPFTSNDFEIFEIEAFDERMHQIRKNVSPKLKQLGEIISPMLSEEAHITLYPRIALHMRRRVNPPVETWVAFSPFAKSYKPFLHLRIAIRREGVRYLCFLEAEAEDKPAFADSLLEKMKYLRNYFSSVPEMICYDILSENGKPLAGKDVSADQLIAFGKRLSHVKNQHASFGIFLPADTVLYDAIGFIDISLRNLGKTLPILHLIERN